MDEFDISKLKANMNGGGIKDTRSYSTSFSKGGNSSRGGNSFGNGYSQNSYSRNNNFSNGANQNKNRSSRYDSSADEKYVGAPYNFIPFHKNPIDISKEGLTAHNAVEEELLSGEIQYTITAETPIFVGGKDSEYFHKNAEGKYSIPGSTMRGLIRSNAQILGFSSAEQDIDDYLLMYRHVANGSEQKRYNAVLGSKQDPKTKMSLLKNVKAGYVIKEQGKYYIYRNVTDRKNRTGEMDYYVLSERTIIEDYTSSKRNGKQPSYPFFFFEEGSGKKKEILQNKNDTIFKKEGRRVKGWKNDKYCPYEYEISYEIDGNGRVIKVKDPGKLSRKGYAVSTGFMNDKKAVYIIPEIDKEADAVQIPTEDVEAFHTDLKARETNLNGKNRDGSFILGGVEHFDLPRENGGMRPVFYIELDGRLYFGFTPRLRLFFDHSVKEGLPAGQKTVKLDYARALFGFSEEDRSYKSRVSFSDAVIQGKYEEMNRTSLVLSSPKPTSYLDYLVQENGNIISYNADQFELRGIKQYWLHDTIQKTEGSDSNKKVGTAFRPLKENCQFTGKVRFKNLKKEELGLLLWSIRLEPTSRMNVGKGKPYGYGRIKLQIDQIREWNLTEAYLSDQFVLDPFTDYCDEKAVEYINTRIQEYTASVQKKLNTGNNIKNLPVIKEFFQMKDSTCIPKEDLIRYMSIDNKEYQSRKNGLDSAAEIISKSKKK